MFNPTTKTAQLYLLKRLSYLSLNMTFSSFPYSSTFGTGNGNEGSGIFFIRLGVPDY
jgi:hypothetical protein